MLTVDFDRLGLRAGERVLDMGCGAGRHAFEMYRRGADVVAFDQDGDELARVLDTFGAMKAAGEVPAGAEADIKQGDALELPFADGEFDRIVAAEVLEHIHADVDAIKELVRVLRPGGTMAITVPRWLPEVINWKLSDEYHNATGGHIRIYTDHELIDKVTKAGKLNDGEPGDAFTDCVDHSRTLVPEHDRQRGGRGAVEHVEVAVADARGDHTHGDLAGTGRRHLEVVDHGELLAVPHGAGGDHGRESTSCATSR